MEVGSDDEKFQVSKWYCSQFSLQPTQGNGPESRETSRVCRGWGWWPAFWDGAQSYLYDYFIEVNTTPIPSPTHKIQVPKDCFGGRTAYKS